MIATPQKVMLHLGLGAFHRAHQCVYMQRLRDAGDVSWSLIGGNIRAGMEETVAALQAQQGAYTLETVTPAGQREYQKITALRRVVSWQPALTELIDIGADAGTHIISFTVTESGYYLDSHDRLDVSSPDLAAALAQARGGEPGTTIYSVLVAILRKRRDAGAGPVTLLCCDNLRHNGSRSRSGLLQFIALLGDETLLAWVKFNTSSPNTMVDRITPRSTSTLHERVAAATGWTDQAPVMAESYLQWVIEDVFCSDRPAWENVGAELVADVMPYEEAKIRILNGSHSCIAWAGTLAGYRFIHEGTQDARVRRIAFDYVTHDVIPCLQPSPIDLHSYRDSVLERFGNSEIRDTNQRVILDSLSKLTSFIVPTMQERLAGQQSIASVAQLPALLLQLLQQLHRGELLVPYDDPLLAMIDTRAICAASDPITAFCSDTLLWGALAGDPRVIAAVSAGCDSVAITA